MSGDRISEDESYPNVASSSPGIWASIKMAYQSLVHTVIRPPRSRYDMSDLGPSTCIFGHNLIVIRDDFILRNDKGLAVACSWWKPKSNLNEKMPCIIVLHGNSSSRLGCLETLFHGLAAGFTICAIDFSGSGLSEGKYVSLGYHEKKDIHLVLTHLLASGQVSNIILWGRSMGAVASILCAAEDNQNITAMVLDSPFSSLKQLAMDLVDEGKLNVPRFAVSIVMRFLRRDIKRRAKFDMFHLKPKGVINQCTVPAFFAIGEQDELVSPKHVHLLHKLHPGPKELLTFAGGHNSARPPEFFHQAINFCRVMCGLLPMAPVDLDRSLSPVQVQYKRSLGEALSTEQIRGMTVKELKEILLRVGISDKDLSIVVEKSELIDLVLKLNARQARMRMNSDVEISSPLASTDNEIQPPVRRHSTGTDIPPICPEEIIPQVNGTHTAP